MTYFEQFKEDPCPLDYQRFTWNGWDIAVITDDEFDLYDPYGILVETSSDPEALARKAAQIDEAW